ncbi:MAG: hypothetical protein JRN68_09155 [Nitrososphaerota archaeon]|jgi:ABC-type sugar transport system ATPase subunit|nr:hypothetical protein [Nitrososphaerota archaeon]
MRYDAIKAIEGMDIEIDDARSFCTADLCEKSTLLKVIAPLAMPDRGSMVIVSADVTKMSSVTFKRFRSTAGKLHASPSPMA